MSFIQPEHRRRDIVSLSHGLGAAKRPPRTPSNTAQHRATPRNTAQHRATPRSIARGARAKRRVLTEWRGGGSVAPSRRQRARAAARAPRAPRRRRDTPFGHAVPPSAPWQSQRGGVGGGKNDETKGKNEKKGPTRLDAAEQTAGRDAAAEAAAARGDRVRLLPARLLAALGLGEQKSAKSARSSDRTRASERSNARERAIERARESDRTRARARSNARERAIEPRARRRRTSARGVEEYRRAASRAEIVGRRHHAGMGGGRAAAAGRRRRHSDEEPFFLSFFPSFSASFFCFFLPPPLLRPHSARCGREREVATQSVARRDRALFFASARRVATTRKRPRRVAAQSRHDDDGSSIVAAICLPSSQRPIQTRASCMLAGRVSSKLPARFLMLPARISSADGRFG